MDKRIPNAEIRRVWMDPRLTCAEAAAKVGLSRVRLWVRAKKLELPPRKEGRRPIISEAELRALWEAEVLAREIAALYGHPTNSVRQLARKYGLTRRSTGKHPTITVAEYRSALLRRANTPGQRLSETERLLLQKTRLP